MATKTNGGVSSNIEESSTASKPLRPIDAILAKAKA
jgi:hypothetical protein